MNDDNILERVKARLRIAEREAVHWEWRMLNEQAEWEKFFANPQWTAQEIFTLTKGTR